MFPALGVQKLTRYTLCPLGIYNRVRGKLIKDVCLRHHVTHSSDWSIFRNDCPVSQKTQS